MEERIVVKLLFVLFLTLFPKITFPQDILVIQSNDSGVFSKLWEGIKEECPSSFTIERKIIPKDAAEKKKFWEEIKKFGGKLIFVTGEGALKGVISLEITTPVVFGGVVDAAQFSPGDNFCGLDFEYDPSVILNILKEGFSGLHSIGMIYDPARSQRRIEEIKVIAETLGIKIVSYSAKSTQDIAQALKEIDGRVDVFLMGMDPVVANPSSFQALLVFSAKERVPLFVPSEAMVKGGGFLGVKDDFKKMGGEMFELADTILKGGQTPKDIGIKYPKLQGITINQGVGEKLKFKISEAILKKAAVIY